MILQIHQIPQDPKYLQDQKTKLCRLYGFFPSQLRNIKPGQKIKIVWDTDSHILTIQ